MNKSNALTLVILVVMTLVFQGCAHHDPTHVWCVSYSCHVTCESGPCSESCGHAMWHGSPEECKAEGGTGYKHYQYANNEFLRRISEKHTTTTSPVSKPKSSQPSYLELGRLMNRERIQQEKELESVKKLEDLI